MFQLGRGFAANGERHRFGERKALKKQAHRLITAIPKLPQAGGDSN